MMTDIGNYAAVNAIYGVCMSWGLPATPACRSGVLPPQRRAPRARGLRWARRAWHGSQRAVRGAVRRAAVKDLPKGALVEIECVAVIAPRH